jgi:hypothetical protein
LYGPIHVTGIGQFISNHLPLASLFFLASLVLIVNPALTRLAPGATLTTAELTLIWATVSAAASVPGYGLMEFIFPYVAAPLYFASPENQWSELVFPHLKPWLYLNDSRAARRFWEGLGKSDAVPWDAWLVPGGFAVLFGLAFFFAFGCWSALIRRQWVERERYAFPLVQVTHALTTRDGRAFPFDLRGAPFWIAFAVASGAHALRVLHWYHPVVPTVPLDFPIDALIPGKPWTALVEGWPLLFRINFSVIGVTYFLHLDVAMSIWFFFILYKLQEVALTQFAVTAVNTQQQVMGAVLCLALVSGWQARAHLRNVVRKAWNPSVADVDDADEPVSYRAALFGMTGAFALVGALCVAMGMSLWLTVLFVPLMWIMATATAWHVSNAGCLLVNVGFEPYSLFTTFFGSRALGPRNLILLSFDRSSIPNWSSQSLMAYATQGFRLSASHRLSARRLRLGRWMLVGVLFAVVVTFYSTLTTIYRRGALTLTPWIFNVGAWAMQSPAGAIQNPFPPNVAGILSAFVGVVVMALLLYLRHHFLWWPLHPLGYALGVTWAPSRLWFSTFIGWVLKMAILRVGGFRAFRQWRGFFLGLVVGEYFVTALLNLIGLKVRFGYWGVPS